VPGETWVLCACFVRGARAGIFTGEPYGTHLCVQGPDRCRGRIRFPSNFLLRAPLVTLSRFRGTPEMFVVSSGWGWAEDLNVVQCRGVAQSRRVEGARVGQPSLQGGCPDRSSEGLESGRCRQL